MLRKSKNLRKTSCERPPYNEKRSIVLFEYSSSFNACPYSALISNMASLAIYKTRCDICSSMFNTTTALLRHRESKHRIAALKAEWATFVKFYNGQQIVQPPARIRTRSISYKQWISGIVESINSSLHLKAAGM